MKLNHDCVRAVLLYLEEHLELTNKICLTDVHIDLFDDNDILYTGRKLHEAGYISASIRNDVFGSDSSILVSEITWEGHKFLDTIRDNQVWSQTKKILSKVSSSSISFVSNVASQVLANIISQYMNLSV